MSKIGIILRAQVIQLFRLNDIGRRNNNHRSTMLVGAGVVTIGLFVCMYNVMTTRALVEVGQEDLIPSYVLAVSGMAILFLTVFYANAFLFGSRDVNTLFALPVQHADIIAAKFALAYGLNLLVACLFMIPGDIVWILNGHVDFVPIFLLGVSVFIVPLLPMCIGACLGMMIAFLASFFKRKNIIALIFSFSMVGILGSVAISVMTAEDVSRQMGAVLARKMIVLYPPARWILPNGLVSFSGGIFLFMLVSLTAFCVFLKVVSAAYPRFTELYQSRSRYSEKKHSCRRKSAFAALYKKETDRFFSSYMAVLNTGSGVVLLCFFSLLLLLHPGDLLGANLGFGNLGVHFSRYVPLFIAAMLTLSCPAASSISLEGKNIWILQSAPVSVQTILQAKMAYNLTLHFVGYVVALTAFSLKLDFHLLQMMALVVTPMSYSFFITVTGISLNKKYPNYEWENEMVVVKQSVPVLASGLLGLFALFLPVFLAWCLQMPFTPVLLGVSVLLLIVACGIYIKIRASASTL